MEGQELSGAGQYRLIRTIRLRNENVPGVLGSWASKIGDLDANIGNVETVQIGMHYVVRDVDVLVHDEEHLKRVVKATAELKGVSVLEVRDDVLDLHRGGKIEMVSRQSIDSIDKLRKVYTPGVASVSRQIGEDPRQRDIYTSIPNLVAMVTDGTAVLGLGNVGAWASMPVMEGKAALLHELVGLSGVPILLDTQEPSEIISTVKRIAMTFGAIQLEDIAAPRCFEVADQLASELSIPVMHDDQSGTAVVVLAALLNACNASGKDLHTVKIGQIGLGAAGMGIAKMLQHYTGNAVSGTDIAQEQMQRLESMGGKIATLDEIMAKSDVVISTTGRKGLISPDSVREGQIIFALSNPEPEIEPPEALEHGALFAADGRSVNNLLGFPGIWRGATDSKATKINQAMLVAASLALFGNVEPPELLPRPLDKAAHKRVAQAVAKAAMETGVAREDLDEDYFSTD